MNEEELQRLMSAMQNPSQAASYDGNLKKLGYAEESNPTGISLYFVDFATKEDFIAFLDGYNEDMEAAGKEDQIIGYAARVFREDREVDLQGLAYRVYLKLWMCPVIRHAVLKLKWWMGKVFA